MPNLLKRGRHEPASPYEKPAIGANKSWVLISGLIGLIIFVLLGAYLVIEVRVQSNQIKNTQVTNHNNNVANQESTKIQIRNLACFAINGATGPKAIALGSQYSCPPDVPFTPASLPTATTTVTSKPKAGPTVTLTATPKPGSTITVQSIATATVVQQSTQTVHSIATVHATATKTQVVQKPPITVQVTHTVVRTTGLCIRGLTC